MLKLYNIFKGLINESVMRNQIVDAINKKQRVKITYKSDDERNNHTGERYIEVYTYGIARKNKDGTGGYEAIRAYQLSGDTFTYKPHWKFFKVDNIISWEPVNSYFKTSIEDRDDSHVDPRNGNPITVNHNGDKHMGVVHAQAQFDDEHVQDYSQRKEADRIAAAKREREIAWRDLVQQIQLKRAREKQEREQQQQELQQDKNTEDDGTISSDGF